MTTRNKSAAKDSYWRSKNGGAQIYYGLSDNSMVQIGQDTLGNNENARLIINTTNNNAQNHILFKRNGTAAPLGALRLDSNNLLIGGFNRTNLTGTNNTSVGAGSLASNTSGSNNTAVGYYSLINNIGGGGNTAVGYGALSVNQTGSSNTAVGYQAMQANTTTGNTAVGYQALQTNTTGISNTALGLQALAANTGSYNTAVGGGSMYTNQGGSYNTALGFRSRFSSTGGNSNTALGYLTMFNGTGGDLNTAVGTMALYNTTSTGSPSGCANTAVGYNALYTNTTGYNNTAVGNNALYSNSTGVTNTAVGVNACQYVTGSNKTCIGTQSGPPDGSPLASDSNERIWIGAGGTVYVSGGLVVTGSLTNSGGTSYLLSDIRLKNVKSENKSGLEKIKQLKVFNYTLKADKKKTPRVGVIAQDLMKVFPDAVTKDEKGYFLIRMEDMFYAMVNAIKEIGETLKRVQGDMKAKDAQINALKDQNKALEERISKLEAKLK